MPMIQVHMLKGRSTMQKRQFVKELAELTVRALQVPEHAVLILLDEVDPEHWGIGSRTKADIDQAT
ncbi:tautomerase family protein [Dyella koreensis]|uniref:Tautomerase n=1 Tax=Dyella koreensis TaxID=311235 RepID=A0ABW8KB50_9GAMM